MTESKICTCPSGDGSLRHPCPAHPAVEQAGGDERAAFEVWASALGWKLSPDQNNCGIVVAERYGHPGVQRCWEAWQARAALAQPSPAQADEKPGDSILCYGCFAKGVGPDHFDEAGKCLAAQAEQAEAERPEVVAYRTIGRHEKHQHPHYALNYYKQNAEDQAAHWRERGCEVSKDELMTVTQHARIVGALRADRDSWAEQAEQRLADWDEMRKERDAALARVAELEKKLGESEKRGSELAASYCDGVVGDEYGHAYCRYKSERDAALAEIAELEKKLAMASDAASKGDAARHAAGGMEMEIQELKAKLAELENQEPLLHINPLVVDELLGRAKRSPGGLTWSKGRCGSWTLPLYAAPVAQAQQLNDLDKQCRDDVARALGLRPNQERGFAWSYLLASIKSCVKASEDSAQAQHSVPDGYRLVRLEHFAAIKAQLDPEQVDAYRGRNIYDEDKVYANWNACRSALDEIKDVFQQIDWDAENELAELLAAAPGKEGV
ncbi:hypothetical protein [Pseudomonas aeruginosa]|uniref:hypothetical protein n=1 Tax=Pseudomonas aeruginosa TaxID=287 RepID=UPI00159D1885|nr:hypothetical protein [Pseudomonas aeruginosa]HCF7498176.1 hypothetical protein [Pseudomonas aeruginosa]